MRVTVRQDGNVLTYDFEFEPGDRDAIVAPGGTIKARFLAGACRYVLPDDWRLADTHPDLIACTALMIAGYFAVKKMTFPLPVSAGFVDWISPVYRADFGPIDPALPCRSAPVNGRVGLCYSGGIDSTAALLLLPGDAAVIFVERAPRPGQTGSGMYKPEAARRACEVLHEGGWNVHRIQTDMEHARDPVGFMNDGTMQTPLMLLADYLGLNAVAYGLILESAYLNKGQRFREYKQTDHWQRYSGNSAACGLPWHLVTAGLSEVVTSRLVLEGPLQHVAQSCVRGTFAEPCRYCWKCFRKSLLEAALLDDMLPDAPLDRYFQVPETAKKLKEVPIKHENVMMYILQKYRGTHPGMLRLRKELKVDAHDVRWTQRWFAPAREVFSSNLASHAEATITDLVGSMTGDEIAAVRAWDRIAVTR